MSKIVLNRISVDKDKRWADSQERIAKLRDEVTELLFECGYEISKPLVEDIATHIFNKQIDAFYTKDLGEL